MENLGDRIRTVGLRDVHAETSESSRFGVSYQEPQSSVKIINLDYRLERFMPYMEHG
jgi:hypothetical protein